MWKKIACILSFFSVFVLAEKTKTTYNPFTGKLDFITSVSTNNFQGSGVTCTGGVCTFAGGGSGPSGQINTAAQFSAPYYSVAGSSNVLSSFSGVTLSTNTGILLSAKTVVSGTMTVISSATFNNVVAFSSSVHLGGSVGTNGQVFTSGGPGVAASWSTVSSGSGDAVLAATQTWTGQNNWTTPAQSTFTYGLTAGSLTVNGAGVGELDLTEGTAPSGIANKDVIWGDSTANWPKFNPNNTGAYLMVGSSSTVTPGNCAKFGVSGSVVDAGAACGTGSSGVTVYPATATASFPFGLSASTAVITSSGSLTLNGPTAANFLKLSLTDTLSTIQFFQNGIFNHLITIGGTPSTITMNDRVLVTGGGVLSTEGALISAASGSTPGLTGAGILDLWSAGGQPTYVSFNETGIANKGTLGFGAGSNDLVLYTGSETFGSGTERVRVSPTGGVTIQSSQTVRGAGGLGVTYGIIGGSVTASNLASGQCVQTGSGGLLTVTGSACGSGGGATNGTILTSTPTNIAVYSATTTVNGYDEFQWDGSKAHILSTTEDPTVLPLNVYDTTTGSGNHYAGIKFVNGTIGQAGYSFGYKGGNTPNGFFFHEEGSGPMLRINNTMSNSQFVKTDSSQSLVSFDLYAATNVYTGGNTFRSTTTINGVIAISSSVHLSGSVGTSGYVATSGGPGASASWTDLSTTFLTNSCATATYLHLSSAAATYLQKSSAAVTYANLAANNVWTGNNDFGGGVGLEIPNGTGNTVDAVGEIAQDTTDNVIVAFDGNSAKVVGFSTHSVTVSISSGTGWNSLSVPVWRAPTDMAVTVTKIIAESLPASTTVLYQLDERALGSINTAGTNVFSIAYSTANNTGVTTTAFANPGIAVDSTLVLTTPAAASTGTPSMITFTIFYIRDRE